jgi:hypothetical protein
VIVRILDQTEFYHTALANLSNTNFDRFRGFRTYILVQPHGAHVGQGISHRDLERKLNSVLSHLCITCSSIGSIIMPGGTYNVLGSSSVMTDEEQTWLSIAV